MGAGKKMDLFAALTIFSLVALVALTTAEFVPLRLGLLSVASIAWVYFRFRLAKWYHASFHVAWRLTGLIAIVGCVTSVATAFKREDPVVALIAVLAGAYGSFAVMARPHRVDLGDRSWWHGLFYHDAGLEPIKRPRNWWTGGLRPTSRSS